MASGNRHKLAVALLVAALTGAVLTAPAGAQGGTTCMGETATIIGTEGDDNLVGTPDRDVIVGLGGDDTISGLAGNDLICGGDGSDEIAAGRGRDVVDGGDGGDVILGQRGADELFGGRGNDTIFGNDGADQILGQRGNDTLSGDDGKDRIGGGNGNDDISGGIGQDEISGGNGNDDIGGGKGADVIDSGDGDDKVTGGGGDDVIDGISEAAPTGSEFFYRDSGGETWTGETYGIVDVGLNNFTTQAVPGTCYLVVGQLTPQNVFGPVSDRFSTPSIGLIAGGEFFDSDTSCDNELADELGYSWILDAQAVSGTDIAFYAEVFIPTSRGAVTDIIVGNPNFGDEPTAAPATVLPALPVPSDLAVGELPSGPTVGGRNATFDYDDFSGTSWTGRVSSVVDAPIDDFRDVEGTCFIVLGTITPTVVDGLVTTGFDTPPVGALVDGKYVPLSTECDPDDVEADGFDWILNAEVTVGTDFDFYVEVFVPASFSGEPTHVIVGDQQIDAAVFER